MYSSVCTKVKRLEMSIRAVFSIDYPLRVGFELAYTHIHTHAHTHTGIVKGAAMGAQKEQIRSGGATFKDSRIRPLPSSVDLS